MGFVLAVADDLFFTVQIGDMAKRAGLSARFVRDGASALAVAGAGDGPVLVLVDLNLKGTDTVALIAALRAAHPLLPVAAYVSHVQVELRQAAVAAGAEPVMARSSFGVKVPELLRRCVSGLDGVSAPDGVSALESD